MIKHLTFSPIRGAFLLVLFLLSNTQLEAQSEYRAYHENINKAKSFKNLDSTVYYYKQAFNIATPFAKDLVSLSFCYYKKNNIKNSDKYFIKAICQGYQFETDDIFNNLLLKTNYKFGFIEKHSESKSDFGIFIKTMVKRKIKTMRKKRKEFLKKNDFRENDVYESLLQNEYYFQYMRLNILPEKKINESDYQVLAKYLNSGNSYIMLELLKKKQFPNRKLCARFNDQSITLLLNHAVSGFILKEDAKEFIDLLWNQVEIGNLTPYDYAKAYDQYVGWYVDSSMTYFGTTTYFIEDYDGLVCMNVLHPEKLNKIREKYWMTSIESFCAKTGFRLPINYNKL